MFSAILHIQGFERQQKVNHDVSLLEEFERTATSRPEKFEDRLSQGNLDAIAEGAHGQKEVAAILGATRLHEINLDLESACRNSGVGIDRLSPELHTEIRGRRRRMPRGKSPRRPCCDLKPIVNSTPGLPASNVESTNHD